MPSTIRPLALIILVIAIASAGYGCAGKHAKLTPTHLKKVVAVTGFKTEDVTVGPDVAMNMGDLLVDKLVNTGKFIVVERDRKVEDLTLDRAAEREQAAKQTGRSSGQGAETGKSLAAQALFVGVLTGVGKGSTIGIGAGAPIGGGVGAGGVGVSSDKVSMIVRWYDTTTLAIKGSHQCMKSRSSFGFVGGGMYGPIIGGTGGTLRQTLDKTVSRAMDRCVRWIVRNMDKVSWEGRIIKTANDFIYINAGSDAGVYDGEEFDVFTLGEELTDPVTGALLGVEETPAGKIRIVKAHPKYSKASILDGQGFARGDIVRPTK